MIDLGLKAKQQKDKPSGRASSGQPNAISAGAPENHPISSPAADVSERFKYGFFLCLSLLLILFALVFNTPEEIWAGTVVILTSPANLITDYFKLANVGATLMNVGLMMLLSLGIVRFSSANITGPVIAAILTVSGFAFFGKNIFNSLPIMLGVYAYSRAKRVPFGTYIVQCLLGTALSPLVSELSFNIGLPLLPSLALGIFSGLLVGFIITPLSAHCLHFHQGYSLYNMGFTSGIIGMVFMAVLRGFGIEIDMVSILSSGNNPAFAIFLYGLFAVFLLCGLAINRWKVKGFRQLLTMSGALITDFSSIFGFGITLVNMALLGVLATSYVLILGGELNGPVIGGIFTVVGFGAFGKHLRNVTPVLAGVFIVNLFNIHAANSSLALLAALFGTTLAPIAGQYGILAGVLAGVLHMFLVTNIGFLHAGMNLYNNGFSGGFIAALLSPIFDAMIQIKQSWKK